MFIRITTSIMCVELSRVNQEMREIPRDHGISVHEVDEAFTSMACSICGEIRENNGIHGGFYICGP